MEKMTEIVFDHAGPPSVLYAIDRDIPQPSPNEVLLEVLAIGVNYIDVYFRTGLLPGDITPQTSIGVEAVGRVIAMGEDVDDISIGDRVASIGGAPGSYSTHRLFPRSRVLPLPDSISDETAAALMFKGLTVEYLINRCYLVSAGQTVLWHAAAGGVGRIAGQWLSSRGVNLIGVVGSEAKEDVAKENGFANVLVSTSPTFDADVQELTHNKGVDVVYDSVGAATFDQSLKSLKPRGMLVLFGNASGTVDAFDTSRLGDQGSVYLTRPSIAHYIADNTEFRAAADKVFSVIEKGIVTTGTINRYDLKDVAMAHLALEQRQLVGSTVMFQNVTKGSGRP